MGGGAVLGPSGRRARERRNERLVAWILLGASVVVGVGNLVEWALGHEMRALSFWPFAMIASATAMLLKDTGRPRAVRFMTYLATGLTVAVGLAVGIPQAARLVRGQSVDWLALAAGTAVALFVLGAAVAWTVRRAKRGTMPAAESSPPL
jgi:undecaprenyl pyrophosphate phosphatase UppP